MKRIYIALLSSLALGALLCGVFFLLFDNTTQPISLQETTSLPTTEDTIANTTENTTENATENTTEHATENTTEHVTAELTQFMESMEGNVIDQDYIAELTYSSIPDLYETENKFMKIWSEELIYTYYYYCDNSDDAEKAEIQKQQKEWVANLEMEVQDLKDQQNSTDAQTQYECDKYYREQIRERTLYLKYLVYLRGEEPLFLYVPEKILKALLDTGVFNYNDFSTYTTAVHRGAPKGFESYADVSTEEKALAAGEEVLSERYDSMLIIDRRGFKIALDAQADVWMIYTTPSIWGFSINLFTMIDRQTGDVLAAWETMGESQYILKF